MYVPSFLFKPRLSASVAFALGFIIRDLMEDESKVRDELKAMVRRAKGFFKAEENKEDAEEKA